MRIFPSLVALAASLAAVPSALAQTNGAPQDACMGLPAAIEAALAFDPRIDASLADRDAARAGTLAASSRNLPQVSLFGRTGRGDNPQLTTSQQDQLGLQATQEFYSFGARRFATQAARARADAANYGVSETRQDIAQGVALAFLDLQRTDQLLKIAQDQESAFSRDAEAARSRLSRQVITLTDASQVQARLSVARSARINAQVAADAARVRLEVLTNQPVPCIDDRSTEPFVGKDAGRLMAMPTDSAVDEAFSRSAGIRRTRAQIDAARSTLSEASRANLPVLSGFALQIYSYDRSFEENPLFPDVDQIEDETRLGLTVNQQLFTGGRNAAGRADARARLKRAQSEEALERLVIEDLVKRSLAQAKAQQKAGMELLEATDQARIQLDNTLREYERGTKTLTDLSLAYEGYYNILRDETNARFQFYSSLVRAYAAIGTLTDGIVR